MVSTRNPNELERLYRRLSEVAFEDATAFLVHITHHPAFVASQLEPLLSQVTPAREPYISVSYGTRETSTCLQVFVWPAGATTAIHDHTSWGAYYCVVGSLLEQRYERLDDGMQPSTARLRKAWQRVWRRENGASTVRPYEQGIHRVANPSNHPAISVHLYGPRLGVFDGRDYDPTRDFVCDRLEFDQVAPPLIEASSHSILSRSGRFQQTAVN
jgi:predicted metal-dependent enzyme (double-stranded beta helix superfamily)